MVICCPAQPWPDTGYRIPLVLLLVPCHHWPHFSISPRPKSNSTQALLVYTRTMAFVPSLTAGSSSSLRSSPPPSFFYSPSAAHQSSNAALPRDTSSPSCSNSSPLAATSAARRIHQVSFVGKRGEQSALVSATMAAGAFADIDRTRGGAASLAHGRRPVVIGGVRAAALHAAAGSVQQEATGANSITAAEVAPEGQVADVGDSAVEAAAGAVGLVPGQTASAAGVSGEYHTCLVI